MTQQVKDSFQLEGASFLIFTAHGSIPFDPRGYGLNPQSVSTSCYRGWKANYAVHQAVLVLQDLFIAQWEEAAGSEGTSGTPIAGVAPQTSSITMFNTVYYGLRIPLDFTGGLLLVATRRRDIRGMADHFWNYERLHELVFQRGRLVLAVDKSYVAQTVVDEKLASKLAGIREADDKNKAKVRIGAEFSLPYRLW
jgi:hypothetical protein